MGSDSGLKNFLSGAFGGVSLVAAAHPFDLVKVRMQTSSVETKASMLQTTMQIIRKDGLIGMYRGVTPVLLGTPPVLATNFWAYFVAQTIVAEWTPDAEKRIGEEGKPLVDRLSFHQIGTAGALAAIPVSFILAPSEQIKIRLQVQQTALNKADGIISTVRSIVGDGGIRSLFRGTFLTLMRDVPGSYGYFATYECIKRYFRDSDGHVFPGYIMLAGGTAGIVNWTIAIPFDTLKSRLQATQPASEATIPKVFAKLLKESGPTGLFKGIGPTLLRAFPASAAFFFGVETSKQVMNRFI